MTGQLDVIREGHLGVIALNRPEAINALSLEMIDGYLTINATRKEGEESFSLTRSVAIPEAVQADKVSAILEHGVLTVTLPKQEQAKPRKITINVN